MVRARGLTLIEVVILVLIVGVALAVVLPMMAESRRRARFGRCSSNLKQIGYALHLYSSDYNEQFPRLVGPSGADAMASLGRLYPEYISDGHVFGCRGCIEAKPITAADLPAGAKSAAGVFTKANCDYGYDPDHTAAHNASVAVAADKGQPGKNSTNHGGDGQNVLYIGSNVEWKRTPYCGYMKDDIYAPGFTNPGGTAAKPPANKTFHSYIRQ
ncbi:MAG: type II secretion system protein [Planctomycetota bacterium]|jgi:hypothetical protein